MKRLLGVILIVLAVGLTLCGCGSNNLKVTLNDGSTTKMSAQDVIDLQTTDERKFQNISSISGKGKVTDTAVETYGKTWNAPDTYYLVITLDDNIVLNVRLNDGRNDEEYSYENYKTFIDQFYNGDIVTFRDDDTPAVIYGKLYIYPDMADVEVKS